MTATDATPERRQVPAVRHDSGQPWPEVDRSTDAMAAALEESVL